MPWPIRVEYAYMLKGLENSWYTVTDPNNVTFRTNIPPGNYCFQVKTRIRNQEWADEIASLDIRIDRLYGLRGGPSYFIFFRVFLSCILFFMPIKRNWIWSLSMSWRRKNHEQEQELNNERLRFYTNITHELRTPLTLILEPVGRYAEK